MLKTKAMVQRRCKPGVAKCKRMELARYAKSSLFLNPTETLLMHAMNQISMMLSCLPLPVRQEKLYTLYFFSVTIKSSRATRGSLHLMKQNAVQQTVSHDKGPEPASNCRDV